MMAAVCQPRLPGCRGQRLRRPTTRHERVPRAGGGTVDGMMDGGSPDGVSHRGRLARDTGIGVIIYPAGFAILFLYYGFFLRFCGCDGHSAAVTTVGLFGIIIALLC